MISCERALELVREHVRPLSRAGEVELQHSVGEVLAEDIVADLDMPPFDQARMDGYALRRADVASLPATAPIAGIVRAGDPPGACLEAGAAIKVMTGAPLPSGAELVVPVEDTETETGGVRVMESANRAANLVRRGSDFGRGDTLLCAGHRLTIADLAVLATAGRPRVVVRAPDRRALVISGGDELVAVGDTLSPGQIRNSNGPTMTGLLTAMGLPAAELAMARDTRDQHAALIARALADADVVVTSGGVSMGDFDVVPEAIAAAGGRIHFDRVAIQPGKPVTLATTAEGKIVLALPGNPCSAYVTCLLFGGAIIAALLGETVEPRQERAVLAHDVAGAGARRRFLPARRRADGRVELVPWNGSGDLLGFSRGDCLMMLREGVGPLAAGDAVELLTMPER